MRNGSHPEEHEGRDNPHEGHLHCLQHHSTPSLTCWAQAHCSTLSRQPQSQCSCSKPVFMPNWHVRPPEPSGTLLRCSRCENIQQALRILKI